MANRFSINGLMVVDAESNPVPQINIRELLDMPSAEFTRSKLSVRQKMDVIQALGVDVLTKVLDECFRQNAKGYDAVQEAKCTMLVLSKILERQPRPLQVTHAEADVQSVVKFMQYYFEEQSALIASAEIRSASFREHCFTSAYLARQLRGCDQDSAYAQQNPPAVLEVEVVGDETKTITTEPEGGRSVRRIYHLHRMGDNWKIGKKGYECFHCAGLGHAYGEPCTFCDGAGWSYYGASE